MALTWRQAPLSLATPSTAGSRIPEIESWKQSEKLGRRAEPTARAPACPDREWRIRYRDNFIVVIVAILYLISLAGD